MPVALSMAYDGIFKAAGHCLLPTAHYWERRLRTRYLVIAIVLCLFHPTARMVGQPGTFRPALSPSITGQAAPAVSPLTLWYRQPAKVWTDALPIGNGRLGAMLFGAPAHDRYQLNEITVWSGGPLPNADRTSAAAWLPAIRQALRNGDYALATSLVQDHLTTTGTGSSDYSPSYQTLGNLDFEHILPRGPVTDYLRWLDIGRAVAGTDFTVAGTRFHRETFASAPDHAVVSRFWSSGKGKVSFTVQLSRLVGASTSALDQHTLVMRGNTGMPSQPGNLDYEAQLHVTAHGGHVHAQQDRITVTGADEATLILVDGTSYTARLE